MRARHIHITILLLLLTFIGNHALLARTLVPASCPAPGLVYYCTGSNGSYVRADSDDATTSDTLSVNNNDGTLLLRGLGEGTYYLAEQSNTNLTNAGYNILNPITVVIKAKDDDGTLVDSKDFKLFSGTETKSGATLDQVAVSVKSVSDDYGIEFEVINQ